LVEGFDRKLGPLWKGSASLDVSFIGASRTDAKQFPTFSLGAKKRFAREDLWVTRPRCSAAFDCVTDIDVVTRVEEEHLPTWIPVRLGLPCDSGKPATVDQQERIFCSRQSQLHILDVRLLDLEVAVGIDLYRWAAGCEDNLLAG
jgi:hypothetical protein